MEMLDTFTPLDFKVFIYWNETIREGQQQWRAAIEFG